MRILNDDPSISIASAFAFPIYAQKLIFSVVSALNSRINDNIRELRVAHEKERTKMHNAADIKIKEIAAFRIATTFSEHYLN